MAHVLGRVWTYIDLEVGVQQGLEVKWNIAVVGDDESCAEGFGIEGDAVNEVELVGPQGLDVFGEVLRGQAKVELDARRGPLAGGAAEELPAGVASESVLGELGGRFVIGSGAEDLEERVSVRRSLVL